MTQDIVTPSGTITSEAAISGALPSGLTQPRMAVVLLNMGAPDRLNAVRPFLFNLFYDPAILRVPNPIRFFLAHLIARLRTAKACAVYEKLGGGSPLLSNTEAQAQALESILAKHTIQFKIFIAMRYWPPRSDETAMLIRDWNPERIIVLSLYPQWSTATSASSVADWHQAAAAAGLRVPTQVIDRYPVAPGFIRALAACIRPHLQQLQSQTALDGSKAAGPVPRLLLSAHGLPERVVAAGDPYPEDCAATAAAVCALLRSEGLRFEECLCYQSRVGPMAWIGPATDAEIQRAGAMRQPVVLAPIAFVSEHSETLVELDIEYRHLAEAAGVPVYIRAPAVATHPDFIAALATLVHDTGLAGGT